MDREQATEFRLIGRNAHEVLHAGSWAVRLAFEPSFDDPVVVGCLSGRTNAIVVRTWRRNEDASKFASPIERLTCPHTIQPTIVEWKSPDVHGNGSDAIRRLSQLQIPAIPQSGSVSIDGVRSSIVASVAGSDVSYSWSNDAPREWHSLHHWFEQTWATFCRVLDLDADTLEPTSKI